MLKVFLPMLVVVGIQGQSSETIKGAEKDFDAIKQELSQKIEVLDRDLAELKVKAKKKGHHIKAETIKEYEARRDELKTELKEMKKESSSHWQALKKKLSESADTLNAKIQKALKD